MHVVHVQSEMMNNQLIAPTKIPKDIKMVAEKEAPPVQLWRGRHGRPGRQRQRRDGQRVRQRQRAQGEGCGAQEGEHLGRRRHGYVDPEDQPIYPPIAKAARVSGTVVLQATISKTGTIENLRVISGPAMLQQAALDAVKTWRYRPYLLNNEPVEVETTVNVIFSLGG